MRIDDISDRMVFHETLEGFGLWAGFNRTKGTLNFTSVDVLGGEYMGTVASLSVAEYNAIRVEDLPELCEYWRMLAVFR